jgi:hypothetical protein
MAYSQEEKRNFMHYTMPNLHHPTQQKQQDMFVQLRECRQQLVMLNQEMADIERRLTMFREHQEGLQTQLHEWQQRQDYIAELMKEAERRQQKR